MSAILANLVMEHVEERALITVPHPPSGGIPTEEHMPARRSLAILYQGIARCEHEFGRRPQALSESTMLEIRPSWDNNSQTDWLNQAFKQLQKSPHIFFL